ncbi:MAG: HAD family phosphatase [Hespellia sp.]|jgi:HAD superfamily hydrolase (TIGR01509 family)|nr:HAD family phosphatase [Hespellia sp.]
MLRQTEAVIFDLDGTLVDSMWVWQAVDVDYMEKYKLTEPEGFYEGIEGKSMREVAEYYLDCFSEIPSTAEAVQEEWIAMAIEKYRTQVPLKSGVKEFLMHLKQQGIRVGIATSNVRELAEAVLESHGIAQYFDVICTACDVKAGKPSPDVYLKAAEELKVSPKACLVFEDVPNGIEAGRRAGMRVCAVEDSYTQEQREKKQQLADYYIQDYFEILDGVYV